MSSPQHPHDQGSYLVPQVEVYDYGTDPEAEEEYDDQLPPSTPQELTHSLAVRTRKSSSSSGKSKKTYVQSGSDTETESAANMSSRPSRSSASGKKDKSSAKGRHHKSDDWADVTEPEERRRIQNRIAQRKFRKSRTSAFLTNLSSPVLRAHTSTRQTLDMGAEQDWPTQEKRCASSGSARSGTR